MSDMARMTENTFPQRTRCKKCRKKLEQVVLDGLYCSYACAGLPRLLSLEDAPRGCKRQDENQQWHWKKRYRFEGEVPQRQREDPSVNLYRCEHCRYLHIGHSRLSDEPGFSKVIANPQDLGVTLRKMREAKGWTKKEVALRLKTRPIRITEIEEGSDALQLSILFVLLKHYNAKFTLSS